jgi:hypothetical protein
MLWLKGGDYKMGKTTKKTSKKKTSGKPSKEMPGKMC